MLLHATPFGGGNKDEAQCFLFFIPFAFDFAA